MAFSLEGRRMSVKASGFMSDCLFKPYSIYKPTTTNKIIKALCYWSFASNSQDSKVNGANMGLTWILSAPDGPHVGPMNLAIREEAFSLGGRRMSVKVSRFISHCLFKPCTSQQQQQQNHQSFVLLVICTRNPPASWRKDSKAGYVFMI